MKTLGIVQLPLGTPRRKTRVTRSLGGKPLLEWVIRNVTESQQLDGVIVALGDSPEEQRIATLVPLDVPVFIGCQNDVLLRFHQALAEYDTDAVVRICADNPFVDPVLIDRLVTTADRQPDLDYIGYCSRDGQPIVNSPLGVFAEWFSAATLRATNQQATRQADRQHVTSYMWSHPQRFNIRLMPIPSRLDRHDVRLTVDVEEDWELTQEIFDALGPDDLNLHGIANFLHEQPTLRERMAVLNQSNG